MENTINSFAVELDNVSKLSRTANGGVTCAIEAINHPLVRAVYCVGSGRDDPNLVVQPFVEALNDESLTDYCVRFALFVRDIGSGAGERTVGRKLLTEIANRNIVDINKIIDKLVNERFGRWDDVLAIYESTNNGFVADEIEGRVRAQFENDVNNAIGNKDVSLLAKWMPSINASSKATRANGRKWANILGLSLKQYRKALSALRKKIDIVERNICGKTFENIVYPHVPSLAMIRYSNVFRNHDGERFDAYLEDVNNNRAKINTFGTTAPEIVRLCYQDEQTAETLWKNRKQYPFNRNVIGVCDTSGSMDCTAGGNSKIEAIDVSVGLSLYLAENNTGPFHNKVIAFSERAQVLDISKCNTLKEKINLLTREGGLNTNVENVLNAVLTIAKRSNCSQDEIPTIVLFSDMEFDPTENTSEWSQFRTTSGDCFDTVFEVWKKRYRDAGYQMPKVVFWNIHNFTGTVPMTVNENGIILLGGFNDNLVKMVLSDCYDPWQALVETLSNERYNLN